MLIHAPSLYRRILAPLLAAACLAALGGTIAAADAAAADAAKDAADDEPLPVALVDTMNKLAGGPYPGYRANHAKGVLVTGSFVPAKGGAALSKAPNFAAGAPVLVRFSDPTGLPTMPDASPQASPHGIAIRFDLPGGANADIVCLSANSFPVAKPEDFLAMLRAIGASGPGVAKPTPIEKFLGTHPTAARWAATPRPAPRSFATLSYYGINAFKFTNAAGKSRYGRYEIVPDAGTAALTPEETAKAGPDYLMTELPRRIAQGPVKFHLWVQLARDGDPVDDATAIWPADRERVEIGTISITGTVPDQQTAQKTLVYFNPLALPDGIEPSDDPILLARPPTYGVSFARRSQ
jgi:catalase